MFISSQKEDDDSTDKLNRYLLPKIHNFVIYGTGEQGKRTCFLHFNQKSDEFDKTIILQNIIEEFIEFLNIFIKSNYIPSLFSQESVHQFYKKLHENYTNYYDINMIPKDYFLQIIEYWKDNRFKECFKENVKNFGDGIIYLFDHVEYYLMKDFIPTRQDILYTRIKTFGINSTSIPSRNCKIYLTGGQKQERKKWNKLFNEIDMIIYVVSLNDFIKIGEDESLNRLIEDLKVYEDLVNHPSLVEKKVLLYLNKIDKFMELIDQKISISNIFREYKGYNTFKDEVEEIFKQFQLKTQKPERLYCFMTQATDEKIMKKVINDTYYLYFNGVKQHFHYIQPKLYFPRKGKELILTSEKNFDIYFKFE